MGQPAAKMNDTVVGVDIHIILVPSPGGPIPTPGPHPFNGTISGGCSTNVMIDGQPAAIVGSAATATTPHLPMPPAGTFQMPPTNSGTVMGPGSLTVLINNQPAARVGDPVQTCNDPAPAPTCNIVGASTVVIA